MELADTNYPWYGGVSVQEKVYPTLCFPQTSHMRLDNIFILDAMSPSLQDSKCCFIHPDCTSTVQLSTDRLKARVSWITIYLCLFGS